jgi:hypothetical protein
VYAADATVSHPVRVSAHSFLRNVWFMNTSYAEFEGRAGRLPEGLRLRELVPVAQTLRARRRFGMSVGLDRKWLGQNGYRPRLVRDVQSLPLTYVFLPYLRSAAQFVGWREGRRQRRSGVTA